MVWLNGGDRVTSIAPAAFGAAKDTCPSAPRKTRRGRMARCLWISYPRQKSNVNRKPSVEADCTNTLFQRVSNQIWNFVLPESGEHSFHAVAVGTAKQRVFLDDVELECTTGQRIFEGPGGAVLQLKQNHWVTEKVCCWTLFVNDCMVEKAALSGNGLRDLRSVPDGEYTIANGFDAGNVVQKACRKFKFFLDGKHHEVSVAHQECVWQVSLDGKLVDQECHTLKENSGKAEFDVTAGSGVKISARLEMNWTLKDMKWAYHLQVGGVSVPAYWNKVKGFVSGVTPPTIFAATAGALPENPAENVAVESEGKKNQGLESLPRGVSYDCETKAYQANIFDSKTKRYVFLGEFSSAELAHKKYIEALERFAPDKKLVPSLVA